ncbi:MAG: drug/metabolite transporter (DMT)-like permease [Neolewinella sp.]
MGILFAILAMLFFATANVTISRGGSRAVNSNGAFVSILITLLLSCVIWLMVSFYSGWSTLNLVASAWFALAGILTIFVGRVFLYSSIHNLGSIRASAVKRLNPFFSVLLGVLVLGEDITGPMLLGMVLIFSSFAVLIINSLKAQQATSPDTSVSESNFRVLLNLGYLYGPISAFAYALGYVARKQGLILLPDAAFGSMVGSLVATLIYLVTAIFVEKYRLDVRDTFTRINPWLFAAGVSSSFGQISYFVALKYSAISQIALIASMEVFVTMFLSMIVFRNREILTRGIMLAAVLGTSGALIVIFF